MMMSSEGRHVARVMAITLPLVCVTVIGLKHAGLHPQLILAVLVLINVGAGWALGSYVGPESDDRQL